MPLFPISILIVVKFFLSWFGGSMFSHFILDWYEDHRTPDDNLWRIPSDIKERERLEAIKENTRKRRNLAVKGGLAIALFWYAWNYVPWIFHNPND